MMFYLSLSVCASIDNLSAKILSHAVEKPDIIMELQTQLDALQNKLEVVIHVCLFPN